MSKCINKKILHLFFIVATLTQFGSTAPMLKRFCQERTKITELPYDCLHKIFKFYTDFSTISETYSIKPLLTLRLVCKDFRQAVKNFPGPTYSSFDCENRKTLSLGNVFGNVKRLELENCDFKNLKIVWPINLQGLFIKDFKHFDGISILELKNLRGLTVWNRKKFRKKFDGSGLEGLTNLRKQRQNKWLSK